MALLCKKKRLTYYHVGPPRTHAWYMFCRTRTGHWCLKLWSSKINAWSHDVCFCRTKPSALSDSLPFFFAQRFGSSTKRLHSKNIIDPTISLPLTTISRRVKLITNTFILASQCWNICLFYVDIGSSVSSHVQYVIHVSSQIRDL
jgi:hypothetical protein